MVFCKRLCLSALIIFLFAASSSGAEVVKKIEILGNRKIETETIKYRLVTKIGSQYSIANIQKDILSIFSPGYFSDVSVTKHSLPGGGIALKYFVKEKPVIDKFEYRGYSALDLSEIEEANDIKPYSIINRTKLNKTIEKIKALCEKKGFYLAEIHYDISEAHNNEVTITFQIAEHEKVLVKKFILLGNKTFSDDKIKSFLMTKEGETSSWLTNRGTYNEDQLKMDIERIKALYLSHGYIQIKVAKPEIVLSPDKKFIYITLSLSEGVSFNIGSVNLTGDFLKEEPADKLKKMLLSKPGDVFNRDNVSKDIQNITQIYEDYGYAFANVIPQMPVKEKKRLIDLTLDIDRGEKVYFGKITFKGNSRTRDKVIRRELKVHEGELYHGTNLRKSREGVYRPGYFSEVNLTTPHSKVKKNVLDIEITVKEKQTGSLQVGAGYSSFEKFMATAQISESNLFGRGQTVSLKGELAKPRKEINVSFDEPYVLDTVWSGGFDSYYRSSKDSDSEERVIGGALRLGYPVGEFSRFFATAKTEYVFLKDASYDLTTFKFPPPNDDKSFHIMDDDLIYSLQTTVSRDTRDNRFDPIKGTYSSASYEFSFGSFMFHLLSMQGKYFHPLIWSLVSRTWLRYGYLFPQGEKGIPVNRRFKMGGIFTVRGYYPGSIGPKTTVKRKIEDEYKDYQYTYGGVHKLVFNQEIQFDILKEAGLKGVVFFDAGNAYDEFDSLPGKIFRASGDNRGIYTSIGWGFRWFSPLGPLRFEFGYPLPYKGGYDFQFMIGQFF